MYDRTQQAIFCKILITIASEYTNLQQIYSLAPRLWENTEHTPSYHIIFIDVIKNKLAGVAVDLIKYVSILSLHVR